MSSRIKISSMPSSLSRRVRPGFQRFWGSGEGQEHTLGGLVMVPWCLASKSVHIAPMSANTGTPFWVASLMKPNSRTPQPVAGQKE